MSKPYEYLITFKLYSAEYLDEARVLEAAHQAQDDLLGHIEAATGEGDVLVLEEETSVGWVKS